MTLLKNNPTRPRMRNRRVGPNFWEPNPETWKGEDVIILGGGPSLDSLDFDLLITELVIGCNDAYELGPRVCDICVFGDYKWYRHHSANLELYAKKGGIVVTNESKVVGDHRTPKWVNKMARQAQGLHKDALGWGYNTGVGAMNLALILGAAQVFLIGFDMQLNEDGESNWHANNLDEPSAKMYDRMLKGFRIVGRQLPHKFPDAKVFNVTDDSRLDSFPKIATEVFWNGRKTE